MYILFTFLWVSVVVNLGWLFAAEYTWWAVPAALASWFLVDAMSGLVHMYMDYKPCQRGKGFDKLFFYEGWRGSDEYVQLKKAVFSRASFFEQIVFDFKIHHPRPGTLGRRTWHEHTRSLAIIILPVSIALNILWFFWLPEGWLLLAVDVFLLGAIFSQYFHGTLHREQNPWIIVVMRRLHLLLTPEKHQIHHDTLTRDFATINGWSNPLLNHWFNAMVRRGGFDKTGLEPHKD